MLKISVKVKISQRQKFREKLFNSLACHANGNSEILQSTQCIGCHSDSLGFGRGNGSQPGRNTMSGFLTRYTPTLCASRWQGSGPREFAASLWPTVRGGADSSSPPPQLSFCNWHKTRNLVCAFPAGAGTTELRRVVLAHHTGRGSQLPASEHSL